MSSSNKVEKILLNKIQTAFVGRENCNAVAVLSGTVEYIGGILAENQNKGCKIVFSVSHSPNYSRTFNAYVKRAKAIATAAGVSLSDPAEYFINGFAQKDKFCLEVL